MPRRHLGFILFAAGNHDTVLHFRNTLAAGLGRGMGCGRWEQGSNVEAVRLVRMLLHLSRGERNVAW